MIKLLFFEIVFLAKNTFIMRSWLNALLSNDKLHEMLLI
jgi:hypothetical protein